MVLKSSVVENKAGRNGILGIQPVTSLILLLPMLPFLPALFSTTDDFKTIAAFNYGSIALLSFPCYFMVWLHGVYSPKMLLLVFILLWANDTFAYLTGRLLGKHKLFVRISPGKTIEGSIGGLVFTLPNTTAIKPMPIAAFKDSQSA